MSKRYAVNEVFYSLQGEGVRAGTANVFVRFAGCNLTCSVESHGFDCDTEFQSGRKVTVDELHEWMLHETAHRAATGVIFTGGEPGLQLDRELVDALRVRGWNFLAVETNGSIDLSGLTLDWVTVSPKVAEHAIRQLTASEVKYVRGYGQAIPKTRVKADHYLISPAADGQLIRPDVLEWCTKLVLGNSPWRLSVQLHKWWRVR